MTGKVRIGQKFKRGIKGDKSASRKNYINIDVTSGSRNKIGGVSATTLSPFYLGPVVDSSGMKALIFENYWQYGKMWKTAGHINKYGSPTEAWFKFRKNGYKSQIGKRRPLPCKPYGFAVSSYYKNKVYDYLESRKKIYVPVYKKLIISLPIIKKMKQLLKASTNIMILDNDGPPKDIYPEGIAMTAKNFRVMLKDPKHPFGHGYIVAAVIAGLFGQ